VRKSDWFNVLVYNTIQDLANFLGRNARVINYYNGPPPQYRRNAQSIDQLQAISKLWQVPFKHFQNNEYLIEKVLYNNEHITDDQLKFLSWIRGQLKFEEQGLTTQQEKYLIDQALNLKESFLEYLGDLIDKMKHD